MVRIKKQSKQKEIQKLINAQITQLGKSNWLYLFWALAHFPFSTTEELRVLSGKSVELTSNKIQAYLRRAVKWGWVSFVTRYNYPTGVAELNPLAVGGLSCLFYKPGLPLERLREQEYFDSLEMSSDIKLTYPTIQTRHFYLTPKGARVLAQLAKVWLRETSQSAEIQITPVKPGELVKLYGFEEKEALTFLQRLEGLHQARQFLLKLVSVKFLPSNNLNFVGWCDGGLLYHKFNPGGYYSSLALTSYFDAIVVTQEQLLFLVADTERLPPSWLIDYLAKITFKLADKAVIQQDLRFIRLIRYQGDNTSYPDLTDKLEAMVNRKLSGFYKFSGKVEPKIVIITRTKPRAVLWQEAIARINSSYSLYDKPFSNFEVIEASELDEKVKTIAGSATYPIETDPLQFEKLENFTSELMVAVKSMKSFLARQLTSLPQNRAARGKNNGYETALPGESADLPLLTIPKVKVGEKQELITLLKNPSKRKLLFILHCYPLLDLLACSRLSGVEMTHLTLIMEELRKAGLVGKFWGDDARKMRRFRQEIAENNNEYSTDIPPNPGEVPKFSFISAPTFEEGQIQGENPQSNASKSLRKPYQSYGQTGANLQAGRFQFALQEARLNRFFYFLTEGGLKVLLWLEGFPVLFEPRYRGEITRINRIRREVAAQERKLIVRDSIENWRTANNSEMPEEVLQNPLTGGLSVEKANFLAGYSWPTLLIEHGSGVAGIFLSFPSRHLSLPFRTTPAIYPVSIKKIAAKDKTALSSDLLLNQAKEIIRRPLFYKTSQISLESWQVEPFSHRYYLQPEMVARQDYALPHSYKPAFEVLKQEAGGETGQCFPDGYGEIFFNGSNGVKTQITLYLEYERGKRNLAARYTGKISSYLNLFWSEWLLASIGLGKPLPSAIAAPRILLLVASDANQEQKLVALFKETIQQVLFKLLEEAHYQGFGPFGSHKDDHSTPKERIANLLKGLGLQIFSTYEYLVNKLGVLSSIWQPL